MLTLHFKECGSTNDEAWKAFDSGTPCPALCIAEIQTKGRGQMGRTWISDDGGNLYMSLLSAPPTQGLELVPLAAGVAAAKALVDILSPAPVPTDFHLRWPNDLYISDAKLGGILCESRIHDGLCVAIVVGLGLNVSSAPCVAVLDRVVTALKNHLPALDAQDFQHRFAAAWSNQMLQEIDALSTLGKGPLIQKWNSLSKTIAPIEYDQSHV